MATLGDRTVDGTFTSLTSTGVTAIIFLVIGFSLEEYLKRLRRYPDEDKRRAAGEEVKDRGSEGWAMVSLPDSYDCREMLTDPCSLGLLISCKNLYAFSTNPRLFDYSNEMDDRSSYVTTIFL